MRANKMYMYVCVSAKLTKYGNNVIRNNILKNISLRLTIDIINSIFLHNSFCIEQAMVQTISKNVAKHAGSPKRAWQGHALFLIMLF